MPYTVKQPVTEEEFTQYYHLRWLLLRAPWDEPQGSEKDDIEDQCFHAVVFDEQKQCIGVGRLQLNSKTEAQIRYMAVVKAHEKKGVGTRIIDALEDRARERNIKTIVLDAREPAICFYLKLGYIQKEKTYLLFNSIQHYRMEKSLQSTPYSQY